MFTTDSVMYERNRLIFHFQKSGISKRQSAIRYPVEDAAASLPEFVVTNRAGRYALIARQPGQAPGLDIPEVPPETDDLLLETAVDVSAAYQPGDAVIELFATQKTAERAIKQINKAIRAGLHPASPFQRGINILLACAGVAIILIGLTIVTVYTRPEQQAAQGVASAPAQGSVAALAGLQPGQVPTQEQIAAIAAAAASQGAGLLPPGQPVKPTPEQVAEISRLKKELSPKPIDHAIRFGAKDAPESKTINVFTDPNCPYCKEFEKVLASLPKEYAINLFAVGFRDGSLAQTESVMCAKDPAAAWRKLMATGEVDSASCEKGKEGNRSNIALFQLLGLTATPTIVTTDNRIYEGGMMRDKLIAFIDETKKR